MTSKNEDTLRNQLILSFTKGIGIITARYLVEKTGSVDALFRESERALLSIPGITGTIISELTSKEIAQKADSELSFLQKHDIDLLFFSDDDFPERLHSCVDSPMHLYKKGNSNLSVDRVISIVGTRNASSYGKQICKQFIKELSEIKNPPIIISGLAYGIDITSHMTALEYGLETFAVLAHGLDRIYPFAHRETATKMIGQGGLLTEFHKGTEPERYNFIKRNRIIAGLSDATVVVESDIKGGALVTANIANSYNREVFAIPGRLTDPKSSGCNKLVYENKAMLFNGTDSFLRQMGWDDDSTSNAKATCSRLPFPDDLDENQKKIMDILAGGDECHINELSIEANITLSELFSILLDLELKDLIISVPGGMYRRK